MKPFNNTALLERIDRCMEQLRMATANREQQDNAHQLLALLTAREREVMHLVVAGRSNKAIAADLEISIKTVEAHRAKIMQKLQAKSLAELVRLALTLPTHQGKP
jgi:two-component system response regulator TtrR